jgi:hypothetical protein
MTCNENAEGVKVVMEPVELKILRIPSVNLDHIVTFLLTPVRNYVVFGRKHN